MADKEKSPIEKIDEQIESIKNIELEEEKEEEEEENEGKTKKIDSIDDIEDTKEDLTINETATKEQKDDTKIIEKHEMDSNKDENEIGKQNAKKKLIISVIMILVMLILIIILCAITNNKTTKTKNKTKELTKERQEKIINGYGDALKGIIAVYYDKQNVLLEFEDAVKLIDYKYKVECKEHEIYEDGNIYLNKCQINDKKTSYSYGEKQEKKETPIIKDDDIKVYVSKETGKATLKEPSKKDDYETYGFNIEGAYQDLTLLSEKDSPFVLYYDNEYLAHMINFKTKEKILDGLNYQAILPIQYDDKYDSSFIAIQVNDKWGIYNIKTNERVVSHKYDNISPRLYMGTSGPATSVNALEDGVIAVENHNYDYSKANYGILSYRENKELLPLEYKTMLHSGKYLWTIDDFGDGHIFDHYGEELLKDKYDKIYWAVDGKYILVQDNNELKLISIKGKELYNYKEVELGNINYGLSYNDGALFQFDNPKNEADDNETECLEVIYDSSNNKGEIKSSACGGIAKPILYLYPQKTTNIKVTFSHPEYLETTYPKFIGEWNVKAYKNGDLYDKDGKYYYGLYWDEKQVHQTDFKEGFYVEKDEAIKFLEEKLEIIGLNKKEKNEFIMYWLPIIEKNEKNLIYFELTEEREKVNKINITPKPDSLLRVVIHVKKVKEKVNIKEEKITRFQRKGFTAVEWGGTTY